MLEIGGADVHPSNAEPLALLDAGRAFVRFVMQVMADGKLDADLVGFEVVDKCIAYRTRLTNQTERVAAQLQEALGEPEHLSPEAMKAYRKLGKAVRRVAPGVGSARLHVGGMHLEMPLRPRSRGYTMEMEEAAKLITVGTRSPSAVFEVPGMGTVKLSLADSALSVLSGNGVYQWYRIKARVRFDAHSHRPMSGVLLDAQVIHRAQSLDELAGQTLQAFGFSEA